MTPPYLSAPDVLVDFSEPDGWLEDHQLGQAAIWADPDTGAPMYSVVARTDISADALVGLCTWAANGINQVMESGDPDANGWYRSAVPGRWYVICGTYYIPSLD